MKLLKYLFLLIYGFLCFCIGTEYTKIETRREYERLNAQQTIIVQNFYNQALTGIIEDYNSKLTKMQNFCNGLLANQTKKENEKLLRALSQAPFSVP